MAIIRLGRYEARQGNLPPVCIRCGIAARGYRRKVFVYRPWWIYLGIPFGLLPFFVLAWIWSKPARVRVPLCSLHRILWRWQQPALISICSIVSIGWGLIPFALMELEGRYTNDEEKKILIVSSLAIVAGLGLYVAASIMLKYLGIHATEVNANSVTLTGVAAEFVEAVRVAQQTATSQPKNGGDPALQRMETGP